MSEIIKLKFELKNVLSEENALVHLKIDKSSDEYDEIVELLREAYRIGMPCAVLRECYVDSSNEESVTIDGVKFEGALVAEKLSGVHRVFPYVASSGLELSTWADSLEDNLMNFYANSFNQYVVGAMSKLAVKAAKDYSGVEKFVSLNPGSLPDWPITQQQPLFQLLDGVTNHIGVQLTPSFLMLPIKSVSGILFPSSVEWFNCMRCRRTDCQGRRVDYSL